MSEDRPFNYGQKNYGSQPPQVDSMQPGGVQYPGQPAGGAHYPGQPAGGAQYPGQPAGGAQYPGQPAGAYQGGYQAAGAQPAGYAGGYPGGYQGGPPAGAAPTGYPGAPPAGAAASGGYPGNATGGPPAGSAGTAPGMVDQPSYEGPTPEKDVQDNPNASAPAPSAPPMDRMDQVLGYENIGFDSIPLPPPSYDEATSDHHPERRPVSNVPVITDDVARDALIQHVSEHCCYGSKPAKELDILDLKSSSAFHYVLETFTEGRSTSWAYEPYRGQPLDTAMNGPAPLPWDIPIGAPIKFKQSSTDVEVPHTASVKPCHECIGNGRVRCYRCMGRGRIICNSCSGTGRTTVYENEHHHHRECTWCHGSGRRRCYTCHGHGQLHCKTCDAKGQLKCYIKLTVKWMNHKEDHISQGTQGLPPELVRDVSGQTAFEEENPRVWPINHFPDPTINQASNSLVNKHAGAFPTEHTLLQRHCVRIIPVTEALYKWRERNSTFIVYGFEHKVYAPDYPQQCCCGCTIL